MEKVISVEERIRRAENRYNQRNGIKSSYDNDRNNNSIKVGKKFKKLIMQCVICLMVYMCFYVAFNNEYIFSEEFRNEIKNKINVESVNQFFINAKNFINKNILGNSEKSKEEKEENFHDIQQEENKNINQEEKQDVNEENNVQNQIEGDFGNEVQNQNKDNSISKINEEIKNEISKEEENTKINKIEDENSIGGANAGTTEKTQMEKDAEYIKSKISFIVPVNGTISSTFGLRNPTTSTVPKNHTGVDIAANAGTIIKSATDGKVILASSEGDYGNHYKIQFKDIIIIYAHCKKLYLKQGATVKQGQKIAEVGSTGNSTGPHLHFEIRIEDRKVDPQMILNI